MSSRACLAYYNTSRYALLLPDDTTDAGRRYAQISHSTSFDFGTSDFAIEFSANWDSTISNQSAKKVIVKNSYDYQDLDTYKGWSICLIPNTNSIWVGFNDGNASMVSFQWDNIYEATYDLNNDAFFRLEFDRDVGCTLYAYGEKVSTKTEITGRQNSITNTYALVIGGHTGQGTTYFKGCFNLLRIDIGAFTAYGNDLTKYREGNDISNGATWNKDAYLKYAYQLPFELGHYQNSWEFQNTLTDHSGGLNSPLTFSLYDGGNNAKTATYGVHGNWKFSTTFDFDPISYDGHEFGFVDLDSRMRGLDGTLKVYRGPVIRYKNWKFKTNSVEQLFIILGAYHSNSPLTIYDVKDVDTNQFIPHSFRGYMISPPVIRELIRKGDYFNNGTEVQRIWEIDIELVES